MLLEEQVHTTKKEQAGLGVKDLFYKYIRFLPLFIICVALSLFVAYVYLRYATLVYESTGTLVIRDDKNSGASNDKLEQILVSDGKKNIQNEIEYLQSRPLMERVVNALNLNFTYLAQGKIKELNVYKSCPFTVEAFQITDSSSSFTLIIQFENENSFRINNESSLFTFGQVFKNKNGVFRLTRNNFDGFSPEYHVVWQPTPVVAMVFWVASFLSSITASLYSSINWLITSAANRGFVACFEMINMPVLALGATTRLPNKPFATTGVGCHTT